MKRFYHTNYTVVYEAILYYNQQILDDPTTAAASLASRIGIGVTVQREYYAGHICANQDTPIDRALPSTIQHQPDCVSMVCCSDSIVVFDFLKPDVGNLLSRFNLSNNAL